MARKLKIWAGLGMALAVLPTQASFVTPAAAASVAGEAGETATVAHADSSQAEYIAALGLLEAYVQLADKLKSADAKKRAQELVVELTPNLTKHKTQITAVALSKMSTTHHAIKIARGTGEDVAAHHMVMAVVQLLHRSSEEYLASDPSAKPGVLSGQQKAWGLVQAARSIMKDVTPAERAEHKAPLAEVDAALAKLDVLWPDLKSNRPSQQDPHLLAAAAAKVEFAASAIP